MKLTDPTGNRIAPDFSVVGSGLVNPSNGDEAGYGSSSRIYERAAAELGMTPATYARGGLGAEIGFAIAPSPLGRLLAAATPKGVCFVGIGEDDRRLESELRAEFPKA